MPILAVDTCLGAASVAVRWHVDGIAHCQGLYEERDIGHAERIVPMIEELMRGIGIGFPELTRIAVTIGPGTFTGVRTGIAVARALALALGIPVAGTTSLAVMAEAARRDAVGSASGIPITVAADARRGEVYGQLFAAAGPGMPASAGDAYLATVAEAAARLPEQPCLVVGSGAPAVVEAAAALGKQPMLGTTRLEPDARMLAAMADMLPLHDPVRPLYLRAPDAKPQTGRALPRA